MANVSLKPNLKIDPYQGQYESLYILPKLKKRASQFDKTKKATRILRNLSCDASAGNPDIPTLPTWVLKALVSSHLCGDFESNWRESIYMTLTFIAQCAYGVTDFRFSFVQTDKTTPLLPTSEGITVDDVYQFAVSLIKYMDQQNTHK